MRAPDTNAPSGAPARETAMNDDAQRASPPSRLPAFDEAIAQSLIAANDMVEGLPSYLAIRFENFSPGRLVATMSARKELLTPMGAIHGGVMAGFVDHAMGCVLYPHMKAGQWAATTEFKLNYLAAVRGGELRAESSVVSMGRRSGVVRVDVTNAEKLVCVAQGTLLISDPPGASSKR